MYIEEKPQDDEDDLREQILAAETSDSEDLMTADEEQLLEKQYDKECGDMPEWTSSYIV